MDEPSESLTLLYPEVPFELERQSPPNSYTHYNLSVGHGKPTFGPAASWFDVKVFYIRVSSCLLSEAPNSLFIVFPKREINTELEVNGGRISPLERAWFTLRRDRVDTDSAEVTYVNTNNLRTTGDLAFEVYDRDELVLSGMLSRTDCGKDHRLLVEVHSSVGTSPLSNKAGWNMDCTCGIRSQDCCFLKGRTDFSMVSPSMEVYVAGRSSGLPIVLTQTVHLTARRKNTRCCTLDAIPEEEAANSNKAVADQAAEDESYAEITAQPLMGDLPQSIYFSDVRLGGEEGELSSFNAGVRVGVGLGLGMCLGIGIGLGILLRTYSAAAGSFKRRLF